MLLLLLLLILDADLTPKMGEFFFYITFLCSMPEKIRYKQSLTSESWSVSALHVNWWLRFSTRRHTHANTCLDRVSATAVRIKVISGSTDMCHLLCRTTQRHAVDKLNCILEIYIYICEICGLFAMQIPRACGLLGSIIDSRHSHMNTEASVGAFILYAVSLSVSH